MKRGRPLTGGNSRNSQYYVKKVRKADSKGCSKISTYFSVGTEKTAIDDENVVENASSPAIEDVSLAAEGENAEKNSSLPAIDDSLDAKYDNAEKNKLSPAIDEHYLAAEDQNAEKNKSSSAIDDSLVAEGENAGKNSSSPAIDHSLDAEYDNAEKNELSPAIDEHYFAAEDQNAEKNKSSPVTDDSLAAEDEDVGKNVSPAIFEKKKPFIEKPMKETNRKSKFPLNVQSYEKLYNWVYYSVSAEGFLCKLCSVYFSNGPWIDKGVNFGDHPTRCIKKHESSAKHQQGNAASKVNLNISSSIVEGSKSASQKTKETNQKLITKYIKILYFMIKKQWAVTENFASLVKFIGEDLGEKDIESYLSTCGKNSTYLSSVSVQNLTEAISIFLEEKTLMTLKLSGPFALLADESTDEAQREQLGLIARYKVHGTNEIKEEYLGIVNLSTLDAESITSAIETFFIAKNIAIKNCLFVSFDGANVMSGEYTGVQRRIKNLSPHSLFINCRNHRLALVFAHLKKKYVLLLAVDALLVSLWKLFHYSPTKQQIFKDLQGEVYSIRILKILKVSVTRWLSHGLACQRVSDRYQPLVEALDIIFFKNQDPEVKGIREQLLDPDNLLCILFLADFLKIVNKLTTWLQCPNIMFSSINAKVSCIISEVDNYISDLMSGENFKKCGALLQFAEERTVLSRKTRKLTKKKKSNADDVIQHFKESFVKDFIEDFRREMKMAFKIDSKPLCAFNAFTSLDLDLAPKEDSCNSYLSSLLFYYGQEQKDEFSGVLKTSPPVIDAAAAVREIPDFKKEISLAKVTFDLEKGVAARELLIKDKEEDAKRALERKITTLDVLKLVSKDSNSQSFPNMLKLLSLSAIIPSSTASVERLFSRMNLVCSELKSRMSQETLDRHLRIIINGPEKLTDPECEEIVKIFKQTGSRRILL